MKPYPMHAAKRGNGLNMINPRDLPVYAFDVSGTLIEVPESALEQYEAWGISRVTGAKMYAGGFTPEVLSPYLNSKVQPLIDNAIALGNVKSVLLSIPTPRRRKQRRQLKPLKPWQQKAVKGDERIPIHKGK